LERVYLYLQGLSKGLRNAFYGIVFAQQMAEIGIEKIMFPSLYKFFNRSGFFISMLTVPIQTLPSS
jgi:hypothetical protein